MRGQIPCRALSASEHDGTILELALVPARKSALPTAVSSPHRSHGSRVIVALRVPDAHPVSRRDPAIVAGDPYGHQRRTARRAATLARPAAYVR